MSLTLFFFCDRGGFFTGRINSREDKLDDKDTFNPANGWLGPILRKRYLKDGQLEALKVVQAAAVCFVLNRSVFLAYAGLSGETQHHHS